MSSLGRLKKQLHFADMPVKDRSIPQSANVGDSSRLEICQNKYFTFNVRKIEEGVRSLRTFSKKVGFSLHRPLLDLLYKYCLNPSILTPRQYTKPSKYLEISV